VTDRPETDPPSDDESDVARFAGLADAPVMALGLSSSDADDLRQALNVETVRDLAENKQVRRAQAIVNLAKAKR